MTTGYDIPGGGVGLFGPLSGRPFGQPAFMLRTEPLRVSALRVSIGRKGPTKSVCVPASFMVANAGRYFVTKEQQHELRRLDGFGPYSELLDLFDRHQRRRRAGLNRPRRHHQGSGAACNPTLQTEVARGGLRHSTAAQSGPPTPLPIPSQAKPLIWRRGARQ